MGFFKDAFEVELCWVRIEGMYDSLLKGKLLSEPLFIDLHQGDIIVFDYQVYEDECFCTNEKAFALKDNRTMITNGKNALKNAISLHNGQVSLKGKEYHGTNLHLVAEAIIDSKVAVKINDSLFNMDSFSKFMNAFMKKDEEAINKYKSLVVKGAELVTYEDDSDYLPVYSEYEEDGHYLSIPFIELMKMVEETDEINGILIDPDEGRFNVSKIMFEAIEYLKRKKKIAYFIMKKNLKRLLDLKKIVMISMI